MLRPTLRTLQVMKMFVDSTAEGRSGYDVVRDADIGNSAPYRVLKRLEKAGWLSSVYDPNPDGLDRPKRTYTLTELGLVETLKAMRELQSSSSRPAMASATA